VRLENRTPKASIRSKTPFYVSIFCVFVCRIASLVGYRRFHSLGHGPEVSKILVVAVFYLDT
jgi:hypothetical protein